MKMVSEMLSFSLLRVDTCCRNSDDMMMVLRRERKVGLSQMKVTGDLTLIIFVNPLSIFFFYLIVCLYII